MNETEMFTNQQPSNGETAAPEAGQKNFSQDEVNRIVQDRLAREKTKAEQPKVDPLAEKEQELARRELTLTARERLSSQGLPSELLEALNVSTPEVLEKSLEIVSKYFKKQEDSPAAGFKIGADGTGSNSRYTTSNRIRDAMGLK